MMFPFFFFNDAATTEIYTLSLHDALPISQPRPRHFELTARERSKATDSYSSSPTIPSGAPVEPHPKKCSKCAGVKSEQGNPASPRIRVTADAGGCGNTFIIAR